MKRNVLDYGSRQKRYCGHDFALLSKKDTKGYKWVIAIWNPIPPKINDFIFLGLNSNDTRIGIIEKVRPANNPSDMYFVDINLKGAMKKFEVWNRRA